MTEATPKDGNQTKSSIFPWDIVKCDTIFFFDQKIVFQ